MLGSESLVSLVEMMDEINRMLPLGIQWLVTSLVPGTLRSLAPGYTRG